ncbi:Filamin-A [Pseudolycoriella hygida]|uniref:Filamin-A n=1 Tax=Pseudolycoriella hygida TaxID=35572 RepID=A0A9Q0NF31_9DIPT|nr:Filamin-A [Pseudolycoriella hygida]
MSEIITEENMETITDENKENTENEDFTIGVSGDGIFGATVNNPSDFVVHSSECRERVKCGLVVAFDGPEKPDIEFDHLKDGNIAVTYLPTVPGVYILTVTYNNRPVRGSPFKINVIGRGFPIMKPLVIKRNIVKKVKLSGPGLQDGRVNEIAEIYLDISRAEINCELMVDINGPMVPQYSTVEKNKGIVTLAYTPTKKGEYEIMLRFRGEHVPGSPFTVSVR